MSKQKDEMNKVFELCKKNESKELDFKLKLDLSDDKAKHEIAKDVAAFANGENGGIIIVGVDDKTKEIVGIDSPLESDRIQQIISRRVFPPPEFVVNSNPFNSKFIGIIKIAPGKAVHRMADNNIVYVRRGATTDIATPEEIIILGSTRHISRDVLEQAYKSRGNHWDPADTKLSDGKSELEYIEWSTISFQEPNEDPLTARNKIPVPIGWTGLAPNYPDTPSSSYFAVNCGFMFDIRKQEGLLVELQNTINELHKIHTQAWTLQLNEPESANDRVNYLTGFSAQSLIKTIEEKNLYNVNMAWIIRTLEAINYVITGRLQQEITISAYLPYVPRRNEFPNIARVNKEYEIKFMPASLFLIKLEYMQGGIGMNKIIFDMEEYVTKNKICDVYPYLYLKEEWIEWIRAIRLSDHKAFANKLLTNFIPYSKQLIHMQPPILFGNISTFEKRKLALTGLYLYVEKYNPRPISNNIVLCLLFNPQVHSI